MVLQMKKSVKSSAAAMPTPEENVKIAGQNCTVQADVQQMHTMLQEQSVAFMNQDVNFLENVWNARL